MATLSLEIGTYVIIDKDLPSKQEGRIEGYWSGYYVISLQSGVWGFRTHLPDKGEQPVTYVGMMLVHPSNVTERP